MSDDLFQPTSLDVSAADLATTIQSIEARGGVVRRLDVVGISSYMLSIEWPTVTPSPTAYTNSSVGACGEEKSKEFLSTAPSSGANGIDASLYDMEKI